MYSTFTSDKIDGLIKPELKILWAEEEKYGPCAQRRLKARYMISGQQVYLKLILWEM